MNKYTYDIAISFAEEDRNAALAISLALEMSGFKNIYYYPDNPLATTGRKLDAALTTIYSAEAQYAIVLLSDKYATKCYTKIELDAILKGVQFAKDKVYLIPVALDDEGIKALPELVGLGYIRWNYDPKGIAALMSGMFGQQLPGNEPDKQSRYIRSAVQHIVNQQAVYGQSNVMNTNIS